MTIHELPDDYIARFRVGDREAMALIIQLCFKRAYEMVFHLVQISQSQRVAMLLVTISLVFHNPGKFLCTFLILRIGYVYVHSVCGDT